jgi:hypothetical protein
MHLTSISKLLLGFLAQPGLQEFFLMLLFGATVAIVLPPIFCFIGQRGRTPIVWRAVIYLLAILIGAPAGAVGGYASMLGLQHLLRMGLGAAFLDKVVIILPGMLIGGGLVPFAIARLLTRPVSIG